MSYKLEFIAKADRETIGLPVDAFTALIDTLTSVSRAPWSTTHPEDATADPADRWTQFGDDGLVSVHIDETTQTVWVYTVTWIG